MSGKLRPCPFCGGTAVETRTDDNGISWYIFCNDCGLTAEYSTTEETLVGVWNRRRVTNDSISRQKAIDALCDNCDHGQAVCPHYPCKQFIAIAETLPSVQPEPSQVARDIATIIENEKDMRVIASAQPEIISCKDCKYRFVDGENVRFNVCGLNHNKVQSDDWFCADAERRKDEGTN